MKEFLKGFLSVIPDSLWGVGVLFGVLASIVFVSVCLVFVAILFSFIMSLFL